MKSKLKLTSLTKDEMKKVRGSSDEDNAPQCNCYECVCRACAQRTHSNDFIFSGYNGQRNTISQLALAWGFCY